MESRGPSSDFFTTGATCYYFKSALCSLYRCCSAAAPACSLVVEDEELVVGSRTCHSTSSWFQSTLACEKFSLSRRVRPNRNSSALRKERNGFSPRSRDQDQPAHAQVAHPHDPQVEIYDAYVYVCVCPSSTSATTTWRERGSRYATAHAPLRPAYRPSKLCHRSITLSVRDAGRAVRVSGLDELELEELEAAEHEELEENAKFFTV